jgi:hypothetical protein
MWWANIVPLSDGNVGLEEINPSPRSTEFTPKPSGTSLKKGSTSVPGKVWVKERFSDFMFPFS